ncbi:J domain-containing protein [Pseudomonas chlororaphis]|uniref:J domain-containing protein n=1 Tax=Pseudomonas chlororaphis TaxID=587753 RepID=UPI00209AB3DF|nr:J domain-containing protein [Pseudomonas chlororaphis]MCO7572317.1 J domain-containing protein [Pseudomonas chlororaphis]MCO7589833.1 J domain-containing protein [Pseudomonas chlororaphis]MCO7612430.1 J domain-containing protein [Pseudomonas chlororaphis]
MDCWTLLELPDDADERSIKRSYAKRLKTTRPDEDTEGFQRLREAYETALLLVRERQQAPEHAGAATPAPAESENLRQWSQLLDMRCENRPVQRAEPPEQRLLLGLTPRNVPERWQQALQLDCRQGFEAGLLRYCLSHPEQRTAIALWAVQQLEWLVPWQQLSMSPAQQQILRDDLLRHYLKILEAHLQAGDEAAFIEQLRSYAEQPWMQVFDHRQQYQYAVLQLLNRTRWSLSLLDQVCHCFQWDDKTGAHPGPTEDWEALMERRQQESFYQLQQLRSADERVREPSILAAHLLFKPMTAKQQKDLLQDTDAQHWQACQHLAQLLTWRYPQLIERLPQKDLYFWLRFLRRPTFEQSWARLWASLSLAIAMYLLLQNHYSPGFCITLALVLSCIPVWFSILLMSQWIPLATRLVHLDLWLSERLIPKRLDPDGKYLVLRHGLPQLVLLAAFGALQGGLGMLTYLGMILLNLLQRRRLGHIDPQLSASHPWLTALHWAHWSPLQVVFLPLMLAANVFCQLYYPGFPLTTLRPF